MSNSGPLIIDGIPKPPIFGYYTNTSNDSANNSYNKLKNNLNGSCIISSNKDSSAVFNSNDLKNNNLPENINPLDIPYQMAINTDKLASNLAGKSELTLGARNQIQYLTCQLVNARNRQYNQSLFKFMGESPSIQSIFRNHPGSAPILAIIFIITLYLLLNGFFASFDVVGNIFNILDKNASFSMNYWLGLLIGLAFPIILLCSIYVKMICSSLKTEEIFDITNDPNGIKNTISLSTYQIDYNLLILFIIILYAFSAVLFTIKRSELGNLLYLGIVGTILIVLSIFIYLLYVYIPFFSTGDVENAGKTSIPLKILIDNQIELSNITTNQHDMDKVKKTFGITFLVIFITAIVFLIYGKKKMSGSIIGEILNGFLGSSAILVIPIIWVFNFVIGMTYFYIYPIILICFRFVRYFGMFILWMISEKNDSIKDGFSENLKDLLENFKDYTPSWGLIGIDLLKIIMNMIGYDNIFSESIIKNDDIGRNLSQNKFISSGFLSMFIGNTSYKSGIVYSFSVVILTFIISMIVLFGILKINH